MDFPVNLKLAGRRALVVGGGAVARRKAAALGRAGAEVVAVAPAFGRSFPAARLVRRSFRATDVAGAFVVVAATDDARVNRAVHAACVRRRVPVNVVDVPELCTFTVPATLRRGALTIAISTNGAVPALAKAIRRELERLYPARFASIVARLGRERSRRPRGRARQRLMIRLVDGVMSAR